MRDTDLYLVAKYTARPRDPSKTKIAGYMKDPDNVVYDENVEFTIGLKPKVTSGAGVILNLYKQQVVTNRFNPSAEFDEVVKYYIEAYPDYMEKIGYKLTSAQEPTNESIPTEAEEETRTEP